MKSIISAIVLATSLTTGCSMYNYRPDLAGSEKNLQERISHLNSLACCITPEEMKKDELSSNTIHFDMLDNKRSTDFNNVKSHYKIFRLTSLPETSYYKLVTYTQEENTSPILLFLPKVYFLDGSYNILRESNFNHLTFRRWSIWGNNHFQLYIKIDKKELPGQEYMLITSSSIPYGKHLNYRRSYNSSYTNMIGSQAYTVTTPTTQSISFTTSPSGVLSIESLSFMGRPLRDNAYHF